MNTLLDFPWKRFFVRLYDKAFDTDVFSRAAQTAFYFSFAIFPALYFLVSVFGLVLSSAEDLRGEMFNYLGRVMPFSAFDLVRKTVNEIAASSSGGKLTFGLIVTIWSASAGVDGIRSALNAVYELNDRRSWWRTKATSIAITIVVSILVAIVLVIVFYGWQLAQFAMQYFGLMRTSPLILVAIQWASILLVMLFAFELIYNLLPDFRRFKWIWITPGSMVAIVLWLFLTSGFRAYITFFGTYDKAYGSLGAVMILMLWLYLTALVVMIGGAINSVYADITGDPLESGTGDGLPAR